MLSYLASQAVGAGIAAGGAAIGAGLGIGQIGGNAATGIARQPETADAIRANGLIFAALIEGCTRDGKQQMIAVIGDSANAASIGLHARHGFRMAGTLPSVGFKFDRWVDSVIMTRALGEGALSPPAE